VAYALLLAGTGQVCVADIDISSRTRTVRATEHLRVSADASPSKTSPRRCAARTASSTPRRGPWSATRAVPSTRPVCWLAGHWVADVVYRPLDTGLVVTARAAGCAVADGSGMLVAQAAGTFKLITGVAPELARMCRHLAELVAPAAGVSRRGG
jgi:shikimate dehydrogenase